MSRLEKRTDRRHPSLAVFRLCVCFLMLLALGCSGGEDRTSLAEESSDEPTEAWQEAGSVEAAGTRDDYERPSKRQPRRLGGEGKSVDELWQQADEAASTAPATSQMPASRVEFLDPQRLKVAGLRKIEGKHLLLATDLPPSKKVDALPALFSKAVPHWAKFFGIPESKWTNWRMTGYLMADQNVFRATNLIPDELPPFKNGYTLGPEFWMNEQKTDYYRRHLLLHEGVHGFMFHCFGTCGPPWYMEGTAELLATHKMDGDDLTVAYYPQSKEEVPLLGRIRIVKDEVAARRARRLSQVLTYGPGAHLQNEAYGWCWAATEFLFQHPRYRDRFRQLVQTVPSDDFNERFQTVYAADWEQLDEEWLLFITTIEHAYDFDKAAVQYANARPLPDTGARVTISSEFGWQCTGVQLAKDKKYRIVTSGRYQIAEQPASKIWWCEPGGVTIRYYKGRPLGIVLAAVRPDEPDPDFLSPLVLPEALGLGGILAPSRSGTLYLRVNDSAAELADNAGEIVVEIKPSAAG